MCQKIVQVPMLELGPIHSRKAGEPTPETKASSTVDEEDYIDEDEGDEDEDGEFEEDEDYDVEAAESVGYPNAVKQTNPKPAETSSSSASGSGSSNKSKMNTNGKSANVRGDVIIAPSPGVAPNLPKGAPPSIALGSFSSRNAASSRSPSAASPSSSSSSASASAAKLDWDALNHFRKWYLLPGIAIVAFFWLGPIFAVSVLSPSIEAETTYYGWSDRTVPRAIALQGLLAGLVPAFIGKDVHKRGNDFYAVVGVLVQGKRYLTSLYCRVLRCILIHDHVLFITVSNPSLTSPLLPLASLRSSLFTFQSPAIGTVLAAISLILHVSWLYYFSSTLMGIGYGALYLALLHHVMGWFPDRLGASSGVLGGAMAAGSLAFTGIFYGLASSVGPAWALLITSLIGVFISLPITLSFEAPPQGYVAAALSFYAVEKLNETLPATAADGAVASSSFSSSSSSSAVGGSRVSQWRNRLRLGKARGYGHLATAAEDDLGNDVNVDVDTNEIVNKESGNKGGNQSSSLKKRDDEQDENENAEVDMEEGKAAASSSSSSSTSAAAGASTNASAADGTTTPAAAAAAATVAASADAEGGKVQEIIYIPIRRRRVLKRYEFWCIAIAVCTALTPGWGLISIYTQMFSSLLNVSKAEAVSMTSYATLSYMFGRVFWGIVSDSFGFKKR